MQSRIDRPMTMGAIAETIGLWQVDASTGLASLDPWAAAMLNIEGHSPDQPIHLEEVTRQIQEEDRDMMREIHLDVIREGGSFLYEFRVNDAAGGIRWIQCRGQYALDERGVMTGRGVMIDVTEIHAWSGPVPGRAAVMTVRQPPTAAPTLSSDPLADSAALAVELRKTLGRSGHGALRLAADLLLWEINTAIAEQHVISDKRIPGLTPRPR